MLSKKDSAGISEQDRFKNSLGDAILIQELSRHNFVVAFFYFCNLSAVTFSTVSTQGGHRHCSGGHATGD
jgi:hypothetical protein